MGAYSLCYAGGQRMRVLVLAMDAFGGHGGMAQFNRHFLRALCAHSACSEVVAVPRVVSHPIEALPARLTSRGFLMEIGLFFRHVVFTGLK